MTRMTGDVVGARAVAAAPDPSAVAGTPRRRVRLDPWAYPDVTATILLLAVVAGSLLVVLARARSLDIDAVCFPSLAAHERTRLCTDPSAWAVRELEAGLVRLLRYALLAAPILVGALLGAPVVARSLEAARFTTDWATPPARVRRLARRSIPRVVLAVAGLGLCGWLAAEVQWLLTPWLPRGSAALETFGTWGPIVPARGLAILGLALLVGSIVGHRLAAGVAAAILGAALVLGGSLVVERAWVAAYPGVTMETPLQPGEALLRTGSRWRNQYGTLLTEAQLRAVVPYRAGSERYAEMVRTAFTEVPVIIPMTALPDLERTQLAVTLGAAVLFGVAAGVSVTLRRPRG